jgi:hypothetical protein
MPTLYVDKAMRTTAVIKILVENWYIIRFKLSWSFQPVENSQNCALPLEAAEQVEGLKGTS